MTPEKKIYREIAYPDVVWRVSEEPVPYPDAVAEMERIVADIRDGKAPETVWLLEHPPIYTAGTSAKADDLLNPDRFPVYQTGRGGQYTYHGPSQRVIYLMLDLARRGRDVRRFVCQIEEWIIETLGQFGIEGHTREGRTGIWVARPEKGSRAEDKIAAIGIRVRRWVTFHGVSLNVAPDLSHYEGIVACGISDQGMTSLADLGKKYSVTDADRALAATFPNHFGPNCVRRNYC
ncbi:MAG TPA: lipoyl(octanoyl) transferase LipB [Hyphomicrobiales bacterium]|nr:lipoyl(octanoyl) transferase LipB [Hyphomicrobiales bacterium]